MAKFDIIRAWKDEEYRLSLSSEQLELLPENPAGMIELSDEDLSGVAGGGGFRTGTGTGSTYPDCTCDCHC